MNLTHKQELVLGFATQYIRDNDNFPTCEEITRRFGWVSNNSAHGHLVALLKKGSIERVPTSPSKYRLARPWQEEIGGTS